MRSATDFLPALINTFTNFATSLLAYFGSGRISRLGISLRLGILSPYGEKYTSTFRRLGYRRISGTAGRLGAISSTRLRQPAFGFLAPYFDWLCFRSLTPAVSSAPRTMW